MPTDEELIAASEFCTVHNVEISFIHSLHESGLVQITTVQEAVYIYSSQLPQLEKLVRLYSEMDINLEGIEAIAHLWQQIQQMQDEIRILKNRLHIYEANE